MIDSFRKFKADGSSKLHKKLRVKALKNAKLRVLAAGGDFDDFIEEEIEVLVKEEEDKLISDLKGKSIKVLLMIIGLDFLT